MFTKTKISSNPPPNKVTKLKKKDMEKQYIGSQQHWEDSVNADYDQREQQQPEQVDNREQPYPKCIVCGIEGVELYTCQICEHEYCDKCGAEYNQFTQIDFDCCKPCSENRKD